MSLPSLYLDAFYACAQVGNFTKAADKLSITQSALSQRIRNLEDELNTTLLIRDRSGLRLTEAGNELLRYCRLKDSMEAEVTNVIASPKSDQLSGVIRIGGYSSVMRSVILPTVAPLIKKNPGVKVYFVSREMSELPALLKNGEIDFMILDYKIKNENIVSQEIGVERNVHIRGKGLYASDIFLDHDEHDEVTKKYFSKFKMKKKLDRSYYDDSYGIIEAVKLGLGQAIIPYHMIKEDKDLEVVNKHQEMKTPVILHYYFQDFYTKLQTAVIEHITTSSVSLLK